MPPFYTPRHLVLAVVALFACALMMFMAWPTSMPLPDVGTWTPRHLHSWEMCLMIASATMTFAVLPATRDWERLATPRVRRHRFVLCFLATLALAALPWLVWGLLLTCSSHVDGFEALWGETNRLNVISEHMTTGTTARFSLFAVQVFGLCILCGVYFGRLSSAAALIIVVAALPWQSHSDYAPYIPFTHGYSVTPQNMVFASVILAVSLFCYAKESGRNLPFSVA